MDAKAVRPPGLSDESRRIVSNRIMKDEAIFEKYSSETDGEYTEILVRLAAGGNNLLHFHKTFAESFSAVVGKVGIQVNKDVIYLEEGQSAIAPRGVPHRFFNDFREDVQFRVRITPGRPEFEKSIYIAYGLANDGLTDAKGMPNNLLHLCLIAAYGDINFVGWKGTFMKPLIVFGAWCARVSGIEDNLTRRYFY